MQYRSHRPSDLLSDRQAASVRHVAQEAGALILNKLAAPDLAIHTKPDGSRVTSADFAADALIKEKLAQITPNIPVLSEEATLDEQRAAAASGTYWCVDPLDGTSTAIRHAQGDAAATYFGVLIGLVHAGRPVFGVAHYPLMGPHGAAQAEQAPAGGTTYFTSANGMQSFRSSGDQLPMRLQVRPLSKQHPWVAAIADGEACDRVAGAKVQTVKLSGHRFLQLAEGKCDLALMEHGDSPPGWWDLAAPQAIANGAGARVVGMNASVLSTDPKGHEYVPTPSLHGAQLLSYGTLGDGALPFHSHCIGGSSAALQSLGAGLNILDMNRSYRNTAAR